MKYIFFDFNGTLLDDVGLGVELINEFLNEQKKPLLDEAKYKEVFGFPIIDYYRRAGLDITNEQFSKLAIIYNDKYMARSLKCKLYDDAIYVLDSLKKKGYTLIVLSATEINNLNNQLKYYHIDNYFDYILGTSNYEAHSKEAIAINFIDKMSIDSKDILFIGDSTHDYAVAKNIGSKVLLYSKGHQCRKALEDTKAPIIDRLKDIVEYLNEAVD